MAYEVLGWGAQVHSRPHFFSELSKLPLTALGLYDILHDMGHSMEMYIFLSPAFTEKYDTYKTHLIFLIKQQFIWTINYSPFPQSCIEGKCCIFSAKPCFSFYFKCGNVNITIKYMAEMTCENNIPNKETDNYFLYNHVMGQMK